MDSNGSFYQNGLPLSTMETGVGNVPVGAPVANKDNGSFYLSGSVYTTLENGDALLEAITAQQVLASSDIASTTASASAAAVSQIQAAASAAADLITSTAGAASAAAALASQNAAATSAATSSTQAGVATTQASNAGTSASAASASSLSASAFATTAAAQAGIATSQAGIAATQATNSSTSATASVASAMAAAGSASASAASASAASTSAASAASAATTAVNTAITNLVAAAPSTLNTLNELATALGDDPNFATTMTATLATKAPLASPALTGTPTAPTPAVGTNNTQIATAAFVMSAIGPFATTASLASYAPLASPAFTGSIGLNSKALAGSQTNYNILYDWAGNASIFLGGTSDQENYYRNNGHVFGSVGGAANYATLNASGLALGVPFSTTAAASFPPVAIAYAASITWAVNTAQKAKLTLAGPPGIYTSGAVEGTTYFLWLIQDATGSRTVSWNVTGAGGFDFGASGAPALSTTPNSADLLCFEAVTLNGVLKLRFCGIQKGFS